MDNSTRADSETAALLERVDSTLRTRYWSWKIYSSADGPSQLQQLLLERLPHISPSSWKERFFFGGVYVNGREAPQDQPLPYPCKVEYYEPKFQISDADQIFPSFRSESIVYQDEHVAVIYKPPSLSSMPAKEQRHFSLKHYLDKHFGVAVHMPSRLDVSAQGLVIVSLSPLAHAGLQQAFEKRTVKKLYAFATSRLTPFSELPITLNIAQDYRHAVLRKTSTSEGQPAETRISFSHHSQTEGLEVSVIHAQPVTGRTHQIRVHAASQGMPIVGDNFYGGLPCSYLHLVSCRIEVIHPVTKQLLSITTPAERAPRWVIDTTGIRGKSPPCCEGYS